MKPASKLNNYHYNKNLRLFANKLRNNGTKSEACIWKYLLKSSKLRNYKFKRQRPVLNYIADFMCTDLMLIIEIDGYSHLHLDVIKKDKIRQQYLEQIGFTVIRFSDKEVLHDIDNVERVLEAYVIEYERAKGG